MRIRAETDFTYDARGRMLLSNEPRAADRRPAPRLFLGWTATAYSVRFGAGVPDEIVRQIEAIFERQPPTGDLRAPPAAARELRKALTASAPITGETSGPAYRFPA